MTMLIELFYTKTCPNCPPVKEMLRRLVRDYPSAQYRELDAREHQDRVMELGFRMVPTLVVDGAIFCTGMPDEGKLRTLLSEKSGEK